MAGRTRQQLLPGKGALKEVPEGVAPRHVTPTALAMSRRERPVDTRRNRQQQVL